MSSSKEMHPLPFPEVECISDPEPTTPLSLLPPDATPPVQASPRFRICCFIQHYFPVLGGTENQAKLLNEELVRRGHEVLVVTSTVSSSPPYEHIGGVQVRRFPFPPLFWRPYGPSAFRFFLRSLRIASFLWLRRKHFDLIHVHLFREPALLGAFINRMLKKPILVKVACSGRNGDVQYLNSLHLRPFFQRLVRELPYAIALNGESRAEMQSNYPDTRIAAVIPNGVDQREYVPPPQRGSQPTVRLIYCGRLAPTKDVYTLLNAVILLKSSGLIDRLLVAGDGPERQGLEAFAADQHVADKVQFLGTVDARRLYPSGDIYVTASQSEGMPNAVLEAMASGLVPVCSDIPGHQELILSGVNGFLFQPGDAASLAACITRLATDERLRRTLAANARQHIEKSFSISTIAGRHEAVYAMLQQLSSELVRSIREEEIRIVVRLLPFRSCDRLLEIGVGDGFQKRTLAQRSSFVVLTDLDHSKLVRLHHPFRVACRAENLPFRDASFNLLYSSNVWEHLADRNKANGETVRVLVPGGRILHIVPTRLWKTLQVCLYPTTLPRRILLRLQERRAGDDQRRADPRGRGPKSASESENDVVSSAGKVKMGITERLIAWCIPPIHGTYASHLDEWISYGRSGWVNHFKAPGISVEKTGPLLCYSPYLLCRMSLLRIRRLLASIGLGSTRYVLLQKTPRHT